MQQQSSLHDRSKQPQCGCRHQQRPRRRKRPSCTNTCTITIFAAILSSAAVSILVSPHDNNGVLASAATPASVMSVSPYPTADGSSTFIFFQKWRKQQRLDKQQNPQQTTRILLEEEKGGGGLIMEPRINLETSTNGKTLPNINGRRYAHDIPGHLQPPPFAEIDLVKDEPYTTVVHPIDNAYDRLSQTLEDVTSVESNDNSVYDNTTTTTTLQDMSQSLDSMEGSDDDHRVSYSRASNDLKEERLKTKVDKPLISQAPATPKSKGTVANTSGSSSSSSKDDPATSWAKRNARSIDEGIRFKSQLRQGLEEQTKLHREQLLSDLLQGVIGGTNTALDAEPDVTIMKRNITNPVRLWLSERFGKKGEGDAAAAANLEENDDGSTIPPPRESEASIEAFTTTAVDKANKREFFSRTITGLLMALAEEVEGLEVNVDADDSTPFWNKTFNSINIQFSRLGFRQMRFGGLDNVLTELEATLEPSEKFSFARGLFKAGGKPTTADEAFDKIDVDNSGSLDEEELAQALKMAAILGGNTFGARSKEVVADMASKLIRLYDSNGDGVVDREEYRVLVQDMSALRDARLREEYHQESSEPEARKRSWFRRRRSADSNSESNDDKPSTGDESIIDITDDENFWESIDHGEGSIVFKDMKLDLRRLLFGLIPGMKRILPGGPLILKPFTATVTASWNREDIMNSVLIDTGLRRLVARALSRRVRGIRDLFDGAVFYGRTWKLFEQNAPLVEVQKLEDVQFDWRDRLIITGRARIKTSPDAPSIENGFKLRTKIGTRGNGRIIGLLQPEIAIFAECPKDFENA
jgi:Ca2+-binding EF-hand superfamily protein